MQFEEYALEVLDKIRRAEKIFESDVSWEIKYDVILNMRIVDDLNRLGISLDYYDPDTTYEEDITVHMSALSGIKEDLEKMLED